MVLAASAAAPVIGDVADALDIRRTLPGSLLVVVNTVGSIIVFALLYHWAPRSRPNWRACLLGAVPAGIAIQAVPSIVGPLLRRRAPASRPCGSSCCLP